VSGTIDKVKYDIIYKSREETENTYKLPNYGSFKPEQPKGAGNPVSCEKMKENALR